MTVTTTTPRAASRAAVVERDGRPAGDERAARQPHHHGRARRVRRRPDVEVQAVLVGALDVEAREGRAAGRARRRLGRCRRQCRRPGVAGPRRGAGSGRLPPPLADRRLRVGDAEEGCDRHGRRLRRAGDRPASTVRLATCAVGKTVARDARSNPFPRPLPGRRADRGQRLPGRRGPVGRRPAADPGAVEPRRSRVRRRRARRDRGPVRGRRAPTVDLNGRNVTGAFRRLANGRVLGLVTGLRIGANVLTARAGGRGARLTVRNAPIGGPVFSGPQIKPWTCQAGAVDTKCNQPPTYQLLYLPSRASQLQSYDPANPPADGADREDHHADRERPSRSSCGRRPATSPATSTGSPRCSSRASRGRRWRPSRSSTTSW